MCVIRLRLPALKLLLFACLAFLAGPAVAETRVALVIGNANYQNAPPLANPLNDAEDVAVSLRRFGFEVIDGRDLDKREMERALARFGRLAQDADAALFYYAGHGMQYRGQNYLLPIDAKLEDDFSVQFETTRVEDIVDVLGRARGVRILMLDACRNNPLVTKLAGSSRGVTISAGLTRIERSQGLLIAYATQANQVAVDGRDRNSPFTSAFVKEAQEPNVEIGQLFRRVAAKVNEQTRGAQTPELSVSLLGEFYLNKAETDAQAWARVRQSADPEELRDFIRRHPASYLVDAAKAQIEAIERGRREAELRAERARAEEERAARERLAAPASDAEKAAREKEIQERLAWERLEAEQRRRAEEQAARDRLLREQEAKMAAALPPPPVPAQAAAVPPPSPPAAAPVQPQPVQVASVPQPAAAPESTRSSATALGGPALVGAIQQELKRVGCFTGAVDRKWGGQGTARAVKEFARQARLDAPDLPSPEFLDALKGKSGRVCPLVCGPRQSLRGGVCVAKTCPKGERLDRDGDCVEIAKPKPKPKRVAEPPKPRRAAARSRPVRETVVEERVRPARVRPEPAPAAAPARAGLGIRGCFSVSGLSFCN